LLIRSLKEVFDSIVYGVLNLGRQLGKDLGVKTVFGDQLIEAYEEASKDPRCKGRDSRSIYRWIADGK
jgi:hypothetical protein